MASGTYKQNLLPENKVRVRSSFFLLMAGLNIPTCMEECLGLQDHHRTAKWIGITIVMTSDEEDHEDRFTGTEECMMMIDQSPYQGKGS